MYLQIMHNFNISFIFLWKFAIDVLDLDMPFNCNAEISERPFEWFIWGLQFWALDDTTSFVFSNVSEHPH